MNDPVVDSDTGLVIGAPPAPCPFGPRDLVDLVDQRATEKGDHLALIDQHRRWSYTELRDASLHAAGALQASGLVAGDRVAWTLPNCAELPIGFLASMRLGLIWVGINASLAGPEKRFVLDDCGASQHIADLDSWLDRIEVADALEVADAPTIDPHAPAAIAYTSGTTGRPKGAVHSQHNLLWPGLVTVETDPPSEDERHGTALSHTILNMMVLGPISAFVRGSTAVIMRRTDASGFSDAVSSYAVNRTTVVPTMLHDLAHDDTVDHRSLSSLRHIVTGGAATPPEIRDLFFDKFGVRPIAGYGLSEAPTGVVRDGVALPLIEISIADDGEVCVAGTSSGPWAGVWTPMLGYWRRAEDTRAALRGGVLHTGDLGVIRSDGTLHVIGRRSEMIVRGGANVSPAEVESALLQHESVREAAVFGIADDRLGQTVGAAVVTTLDNEELRSHCAELLARYKVPDRILHLDALPRNDMGKVELATLRSMSPPTEQN